MFNIFKKIALYFLAFYTLFGFFIIPLIVKPQIIESVSQETNARIHIDTLYFNPYSFTLTIEGLRLSSLEDKELASIKFVELNLEVYSLLNAALHIKSLVLREPQISLVLDKNKNLNFLKIFKEEEKLEEKTQSTQIPRIILDRISIIDGSVQYEDYSNKSKFEFALQAIKFDLKDFDTKNMQEGDAKLRLHMKLADGGFIDLKSEVLSLEPFIVRGSLDYEASKLYTQWKYVKDKLHLEVADGKLSFSTKYYFNSEDLEATELSNLNIYLDSLRIKPKGGKKDVLRLKSFHLKNTSLKPFSQFVAIEKIELDSLYVKVKRDENALIDWIEYIKVESLEKATIVEKKNKDEEVWDASIQEIALENIEFDFLDEGVQPSVRTTVNTLNLYAQNISLEGKTPLRYQMNLQVNEALKCSLNGTLVYDVLDLETAVKCQGLGLEHYAPYIDEIAKQELKVYDLKLQNLRASFDANLSLKDTNSSIVVDVSNANVKLDSLVLHQKSTDKRLASFKALNLNGITLNTQNKELRVTETNLQYLHLKVARLKNGSLSVEKLVVPKTTKKIKKAEKDFRIILKEVTVQGAKISFEDKSISPSFKAKVDRIYLSLKNVDSKAYSWMRYYLLARVNNAGKIKLSGSLRHTPLRQAGKLEINKLSLNEITPYLQEHAYVSLEDGYLSLKTKIKYAVSKNKPDLNLVGSLKLEEIFLNDTHDNTSLVSLSQLDLKEFTLELSPNRLFIKEMDIDAFYVKAHVDVNKSMNFSKLVKAKEQRLKDNTPTQDVHLSEEEIFPVKIMQVNVKNGSAIFWDESLPIPFKTNIHDLNGKIYSISTSPDEISYIDLVGAIDEYGSTKLKGELKSANPKSFTDLAFNFRNLDLPAMSGYSASFAGYEIDDGKLFLNLNYDIKDSNLLGENSIIIKNIKLGKELDIEGGSLPLGFVIALLQDSDNIIEIDMPIRGNLDEPDFKYGELVWKTAGNLILKAVTSPFSFLGSLLGIDGDELEFAEFEGGSSIILPSEREKLDNVVKLMQQRKKIILSIAGGYNQKIDKKALQKKKLIDLVVKQSGAKNEEEKINAMTIDLLEDVYEDARDDDALDKLEERLELQYKDEEFAQAYIQALIQLCSDIQVVGLDEIRSLASERREALKSYLIDVKGVPAQRIRKLDNVESPSDEKELIRSKLEVTFE